jgi:hypothetical protein
MLNRYHAMIILSLMLLPAAVRAQTEEFTAYDWSSLPKYCDARLRGDAAARQMWSERLGSEVFVHMHHYCFGLHFLNKAKFTFDKRKRNEAVQRAVGEFDYVIKNWPATTTLRADALRHQQQARSMRMP